MSTMSISTPRTHSTHSQSTLASSRRSSQRSFSLRTQLKSFQTTAEILVGPQEQRFLIHKELLCHHSPFFSAALNGCFAEGLSQSVKLPEERLDAFEHFVHWIYTQEIDDHVDIYGEPKFNVATETMIRQPRQGALYKDYKPTYFVLLDIYSLADRLSVEKLRNATVDKIAELAEATNSVLTPSDTFILYDTIRDTAPLRALVLDLFAFKKTDRLLAEHPDDWHPLFLRDLSIKLKRNGYTGLIRHDVKPWKPHSWTLTKACDLCRSVLRPQMEANLCAGCAKAFCQICVGRGVAPNFDAVGDCPCKPWKGSGVCWYHEHMESEVCEGGRGWVGIERRLRS